MNDDILEMNRHYLPWVEKKEKWLGRPSLYNPTYHRSKVIELGRQGKTVTQTASELEICIRTYYDWIERYPEFAEAHRLGRTHAQAYWENINHDGAVGKIKDFNAPAMMFRMKSQFKEDYQDTKHVQVNNTIVSMSEQDLIKRIEAKVKGSPELLEILKTHPAVSQLESDAIEGEVIETPE